MAESKVQGPDGTVITVEHPDGATDEQIIQYAQRSGGSTPAPQGSVPPSMRRAASVKSYSDAYENAPPFMNRLLGSAETALSFASGVPATIAGGLSGLGVALSGAGRDKAAETVGSVQEAMTYSPRTESGQQMMDIASKPLQAFSEFSDERGDVALEGSGSPAYATAIKTGIEMAPALLGLKRGRNPVSRSRDVAEALKGAERVGLDVSADALTQRGQVVNEAQSQIGNRQARGESMDALTDAMRGEREIARQGVDDAYSNARATNAAVPIKEMPELISNINSRLESYDVATKPIVQRRLSELSEVMNLPEGSAIKLDAISKYRERLVNDTPAVTDRSQNSAIGIIKRELDDFLNDQFDRDMIKGDQESLQAWKDARSANAEYRKTFSDDKFIEKLTTEQFTPETARSWIFGASKAGFKTEAATVIAGIKKIVGEDSPHFTALRQDAMMNIVEPLLGDTPNFPSFIKRYDDLVRNNHSVARELFGDSLIDLEQLRVYANAVEKHTPAEMLLNVDESIARALVGHEIAKATLRQKISARVIGAIRGSIGAERRMEILGEVIGYNPSAPLIPIKPAVIGGIIETGNN